MRELEMRIKVIRVRQCRRGETWVNNSRVEVDKVIESRGTVTRESDNTEMEPMSKSKIWQDKCRKCRKLGKNIKGKRTHGKTWYGKIN